MMMMMMIGKGTIAILGCAITAERLHSRNIHQRKALALSNRCILFVISICIYEL